MSENDSENMRETISALLDNAADDLELRRFLKACEQDPTLLETWERYSLAQSILHEPARAVSADLSLRIAEQIELEAPLSASPQPAPHAAWKDGLTKMAIAASVAAVFLVGVQVSLDTGSNAPSVVIQTTEINEPPAIEAIAATAQFTESNGDGAAVVDGGIVRQYIESLTLDNEEPVRIEHIQESPLYRLVNELQVKF